MDRVFPSRGRRALLLCDGTPPPGPLLNLCLRGAEIFVCTDAAGRPYHGLPRRPDLVIGDFDTLDRAAPRDAGVRFLHVPEQDSCDAEKALAWIEAEGHGEVLVLGAGGTDLEWEVVATGSWDEYRRFPIGRLELPAGRVVLTARAADGLEGYLVDLRSLRLSPERP